MNRRSAVGAEEERADFCASCVSQWCCFWLAMSAFWSIIISASPIPSLLMQGMEVVDNASDENNENTRRKATVVPIKIEYV